MGNTRDEKTQAWEAFVNTGAVGAYLLYCAMKRDGGEVPRP